MTPYGFGVLLPRSLSSLERRVEGGTSKGRAVVPPVYPLQEKSPQAPHRGS